MKISILTICFLLLCIGINPIFSQPCNPVNCRVGSWSAWSTCSHHCGTSGTQNRRRQKTSTAQCGGQCPSHLVEIRLCKRDNCHNGGTPNSGGCSCRLGYEGTCCEKDVDECINNPCQHNCINTHGSYTCKCNSCYTKLGTQCDLRQCKINNHCHVYGTVNPSNQCQDCNDSNKFAWTNNDNLPCTDGTACTKNDRCSNGVCSGTPFSCLPCEECHNDVCRVKPGYCVINASGIRQCYDHGSLRPGHQCQECDSNHNDRWTNNNNLKCNDTNLKTKDDRCLSGTCVGTPYNCLSCETHDGSGCPIEHGYCIIQQEGQRKCYAANHFKPGNPCQRCDTNKNVSTWSDNDGVACNDGDRCTRNDNCSNGQCRGTLFSCDSICQYCNGNSCGLKTGCGFSSSKCKCKRIEL
ncbi:protein crumbs homolog 1-like isoform X2 [Pocillopora verrucosa]|uniref:protein crumbs homolog 1-like isoform X2 n=1 Tax=Pocillopora verrucosa TaxID=203993 RepID=UPI003342CC24